jgi:hypothetical protein
MSTINYGRISHAIDARKDVTGYQWVIIFSISLTPMPSSFGEDNSLKKS